MYELLRKEKTVSLTGMVKIQGLSIFFAIIAILNGIVFFLYIFDKRAAQKNTRRIPENRLLIFAFIGPFGAYAAMLVLRHKTRKPKFYLVPVFVFLHSALLIWILNLSMK